MHQVPSDSTSSVFGPSGHVWVTSLHVCPPSPGTHFPAPVGVAPGSHSLHAPSYSVVPADGRVLTLRTVATLGGVVGRHVRQLLPVHCCKYHCLDPVSTDKQRKIKIFAVETGIFYEFPKMRGFNLNCCTKLENEREWSHSLREMT